MATATKYVQFGIPTTNIPQSTRCPARQMAPGKSLDEVFAEALVNRTDIGDETNPHRIIELLRDRWNEEQGRIPLRDGLTTVDVLIRAVQEYDLQLKDFASSLRGS